MILQHFPIATRDLFLKVFSSNLKNYSAKYHIGLIFNEDTNLPYLGCYAGVPYLQLNTEIVSKYYYSKDAQVIILFPHPPTCRYIKSILKCS